jgi:hypothetical protein
LFIINQYVNPTVANSPHPLSGSVPRVMERVLKLSIPTLYVWLCMFYCFFHLWLNILAELLRFGDREFYKVNIQADSASKIRNVRVTFAESLGWRFGRGLSVVCYVCWVCQLWLTKY